MADTLPAATTAEASPTAAARVRPPRHAHLRWRIIVLAIGAIASDNGDDAPISGR